MVLVVRCLNGYHSGKKERLQHVTVNGTASKWVQLKSGVPQGTALGPLLFLIYINDMAFGVSSTLRLFAEYCILYHVIDSTRDIEILEQDLNLITEWCKCWQIRLNVDKCVNLQYYRSFSPLLMSYLIESHTLKSINQHPYLDVMLDKTLSFISHITNTVSKASKVLNFIKRNLSNCLQSTKETAYLSLVWPTLEYASTVWDPIKQFTLPALRISKEGLPFGC